MQTSRTPNRRRSDRRLATGLFALAAALAVNSLLGPLAAGVVTYPLSETLLNQTIGLEAFTLVAVAPLTALAGVLVLRGHAVGPVVAIPPAAYTVYMFAQYVVGPEYGTYALVVLLHLAIFVLGGGLLVAAWTRARQSDLPPMSPRRTRAYSVGLLLLAAFVTSRYLATAGAFLTGGPIPAEFVDDPSMYWSIFLLDLGVVLPVTVAVAVGLRRGAPWARTALYGVVGWYVLVPISVATMGVAMVVNGDPNAAVGRVVMFAVAALLFTAFAVYAYRPLLAPRTGRQAIR
ncbi:hypothetical protein [Halorarius litoreus]|uniref:hypothetical protein n=1 Tax=Halorarius litoreus TaxID=2962676 RepID=UPI0020CCD34C|nr:hypothetical protein [Halorarius litoreus]